MNSVSVKIILTKIPDIFLPNLKPLFYQFEHLEIKTRLLKKYEDNFEDIFFH